MRKLDVAPGGSIAESAVTPPATSRPRDLHRWMAAHPLLSVLLLTYALTWVVLVPIALESHGWVPGAVPGVAVILAAWGPAVAAVVMALSLGGQRGLHAYVGRLLCWRVHPGWYVVVMFGPAAYLGAGIVIARMLGWSASPLPIDGFPPTQVALSLVLTLLLAALINTEEFAWRGLALPLLQRRHSALVASLMLGTIHTLWHLPYFFTLGRPFYEQVGLPMFAAWTLALTVIFTWIYNSTQGSLLLPVLFHAGQFAWQQLLSPPEVAPFFVSVGLLWIVVVGILVRYGPATLSHAPAATLPAALSRRIAGERRAVGDAA